MSKYHHVPKQAWQTGVLIQCRYGLSGVILFIFLIILNTCIWIYYAITFCRFTFCFYILMAKHTNRGKQSVFNEKHLQKIIFWKLKNYEIMWKKRTDIRTMPWIRKKIKIGLYYGQNCLSFSMFRQSHRMGPSHALFQKSFIPQEFPKDVYDRILRKMLSCSYIGNFDCPSNSGPFLDFQLFLWTLLLYL